MTTQRIFLSSNSADRYPFGEARTDIVQFDFVQPIVCKSSQQLYLTLESFSCPNVMYNVPLGENSLTVGALTVDVPVGQYSTVETFRTALQTAITAQSITITVTLS